MDRVWFSYGWKTPFISAARETITVERGPDGQWNITSPVQAPARADIVSMVVRSLAALRAGGFADSTVTGASSGLDADTTAVVVKTDDGTSYAVRVGATDSKNQSYTRKERLPGLGNVRCYRINLNALGDMGE